tara:strand:- start:13 stop:369 length:357 start_codon:yes stop_codon:yes gene_type:complete
MSSHKIPLNGAKTYITTLNLDDLCHRNKWACSFATLQEVAKERGWDVLRKQYYEEKMLAILILNALETEAPRDAEKAIKAIRSKAVLRGTDWDRIKRDAIQNRNMEHYRSDFERLGKL